MQPLFSSIYSPMQPLPLLKPSLQAQFNQLKFDHRNLFNSKKITNEKFPMAMPNVGMNEYLFASTRRFAWIGTSGVGPCHAICARGQKKDGEVFLAMTHIVDNCVKKVLKKMSDDFAAAECLPRSIEFYMLGGLKQFSLNLFKLTYILSL